MEVLCPKLFRSVEESDGTVWTFDGEEGIVKGTMWITVASRADVREPPHLKFEKAHIDTLGWNYTGYHHLDV